MEPIQPPLLRSLAAVRDPVEVPQSLVELCKTEGQAVAQAIAFAHTPRKRVLAALGWRSASQLSEVISGRKNLPLSRGREFANVVGNLLVQQWIANQVGRRLAPNVETEADRLARLERENASMRAQLASQPGVLAA